MLKRKSGIKTTKNYVTAALRLYIDIKKQMIWQVAADGDHVRTCFSISIFFSTCSSTQPFAEPVVCDLCNVHCRHPRGLRMHLETRSHRMEENYLFDDRYVYNH